MSDRRRSVSWACFLLAAGLLLPVLAGCDMMKDNESIQALAEQKAINSLLQKTVTDLKSDILRKTERMEEDDAKIMALQAELQNRTQILGKMEAELKSANARQSPGTDEKDAKIAALSAELNYRNQMIEKLEIDLKEANKKVKYLVEQIEHK